MHLVLFRLLGPSTINYVAYKDWEQISHSSGTWKSKVNVPTRSGLGGDPFLDSYMAAMFYPHMSQSMEKQQDLV